MLNEWGFAAGSTTGAGTQGVAVLLHGPSGTGKTLAAEALGYDLGQPLKVVNSSSLISKWVGESGSLCSVLCVLCYLAGLLLCTLHHNP